MISVFAISLTKSGFLLLLPKVDDLRPCIFQVEMVKDLYSILVLYSMVVLYSSIGLNHACVHLAENLVHLVLVQHEAWCMASSGAFQGLSICVCVVLGCMCMWGGWVVVLGCVVVHVFYIKSYIIASFSLLVQGVSNAS